MLQSAARRPPWNARWPGILLALALGGGCGGGEPGQVGPPPTGSLAVTVQGLAQGVAADIMVTGPGGFTRVVTATTTITELVPGAYLVTIADVSALGHAWAAGTASQSTTVTGGGTASVVASYTLTTGALTVTVSGLPAGLPEAALILNGPSGFTQTLTGSATLTGLVPGGYTLSGEPLTLETGVWQPVIPTGPHVVTASLTPATVAVIYQRQVGILVLEITGLPAGTPAAVVVSGPGGFELEVPASITLPDLDPGTYAVAALNVAAGPTTYFPAPEGQSVVVTVGATVQATVAYTGVVLPSLNLRIDGMYLTQAAQRYDGTGPLVAGRDAILRVFPLANETNTATPKVRVRLYHGPALVQTVTLGAPGVSVPLSVQEGTLASSWNLPLPGALVQPGLRILADVNPDGAVAEHSTGDNHFPLDSVPEGIDVRALPPFRIRFVPVLFQDSTGLQGDITDGNKELFLVDARKLLPIGAYEADVRATYTTGLPPLQPNDGNGTWVHLAYEMLAVRQVEDTAWYYYAVVKTPYGSGQVGIAFVGDEANTAVGWDQFPHAPGTLAHELGHNMGRWHAPCGGAGDPDLDYPYAGGVIGVWGLDILTLALKQPGFHRDFMSYCAAAWVSDYTWAGAMAYRQGGSGNNLRLAAGAPQVTAARGGLLLWGRLGRQGVVLEPALFVDARAALPPAGPHRIDALDADGRVLFTVPFASVPLSHHRAEPEEAFAFVMPADAGLAGRIAELRLTARGQVVSRRASQADRLAAPDLTLTGAARATLRWDAAAWPLVLVRDAVTGEVLSFARHGRVTVPAGSRRYQLTFSDGVRSQDEVRNLPE